MGEGSLKPGEYKILKALSKGEWTNTELIKEAGIVNPNIRSKYLKRLQKLGFIERDIDTRKFRILPISDEVLLFKDIEKFISGTILKIANDKNKHGITGFYGTTIISEDIFFINEALKDSKLKDTETLNLATKITKYYEEKIFNTLSKTNQEIINKYRDYLLEMFKLQIKPPDKTDLLKLYEGTRASSELLLSEKYKINNIPKNIILIEAAKEFRRFHSDSELIRTPFSLEALTSSLLIFKKLGKIKEKISVEDFNKLLEYENFLFDSRNINVYYSYLKRINDVPKTLIILPFGFWGYSDKIQEYFPETKEYYEKQKDMIHEFLYGLKPD